MINSSKKSCSFSAAPSGAAVFAKVLANSTQVCYTYDNRSRVTNRTVKDSDDTVISTEDFTHDAAGNITSAPNSCFRYDTNNRLTMYNCQAVSYDMDGNMLSCKLDGNTVSFAYDSANRLISAGGHTYTYNAEDVRIRNLCADEDTTYTYNTNCKLSQLLMKTTGGVVTKYVYGRGLIGDNFGDKKRLCRCRPWIFHSKFDSKSCRNSAWIDAAWTILGNNYCSYHDYLSPLAFKINAL